MLARFAYVMLLCMAVQVSLFATHAESVLSCGQVQSGLAPCLGFLQGRTLIPQCCAGIKSVAGAARTTTDRRTACGCLQAAAKAYGKNINFGKAATLPARCGVNIPFKISPTTDCSKVG